MTTSFYAPPSAVREGRYVELTGEEAAHAVRVLRKHPGDEIVVVDGAGGWYRVCLDRADGRRAGGAILETRREAGEPPYDLSIGLALLKNRSRFETFLEKAVELGVSEVIPLVTHRTEGTRLRLERARNMLVAAMKQCGRSRLVRLAEPQPLAEVFRSRTPDLSLIAHEKAEAEHGIARALSAVPAPHSLRILIGPEGGFTDEEVASARRAGYVSVRLGPRRLRAETAALVAASAVLLAHDT